METVPPAASSPPPPPAPTPDLLAAVRYSLPEMLAELALERTTGSFAMEKLNQAEITKLFQPKTRARRASSRSR